MSEPQTTASDPRRDLILDYLSRGRATQSNVESHFGLHSGIVRRLLLEMELDDLVEQRGAWWVKIND